MAKTIFEAVKESQKFIEVAQRNLEARKADAKAINTPIAQREKTIEELKKRMEFLEKEKQNCIKQFDKRIAAYKKRAEEIQKEVDKAKNIFGGGGTKPTNPTPPIRPKIPRDGVIIKKTPGGKVTTKNTKTGPGRKKVTKKPKLKRAKTKR